MPKLAGSISESCREEGFRMTVIEKQILNNQCMILGAIALLFRKDGDDPMVIERLRGLEKDIEQTLDLMERELL
jgi:hypothetical protein